MGRGVAVVCLWSIRCLEKLRPFMLCSIRSLVHVNPLLDAPYLWMEKEPRYGLGGVFADLSKLLCYRIGECRCVFCHHVFRRVVLSHWKPLLQNKFMARHYVAFVYSYSWKCGELYSLFGICEATHMIE